MSKKVLLIVDVQEALVRDCPYNKDLFLGTLKQLITKCHKKNIEIIYVQHTEDDSDDFLHGSVGWQIYHEVKPSPGEKIFEKNYNSSFKNTGLKEYLDENNINSLIITGMQTEYCIDATIKVAFEYGFQITIPENAVTTFDNDIMTGKQIYEYYMYKIWSNRYAKIKDINTIMNELDQDF
jgi:nicotinamidase-related amidase